MSSQQPQIPFVMMPQMPTPQMSHFHGVVPPRYDAAMRFLEYCHLKEMERPVVNDISVGTVPGLELTIEEQMVRRTSLRTIQKYLRGELPVDTWEWLTWRHDYIETVRMMNGHTADCPACSGVKGMITCPWCGGAGSIIYQPFHHNPVPTPEESKT